MDVELPTLVETASGERLLVRETEPGDVALIERLYDSLDADATYRRFFSAAPPKDGFYERVARVAERGGVGIVVIDASDADPQAHEMIAEANVEPLANGNGELAITVDGRWRGWLGPYVLSILREVAARRGIPNLEAEILTCNRPMRALTRRTGEVLVPPSDWQTVRVVLASEGAAPSWPETAKPTVLVELQPASLDSLAHLVEAGYEVLACTGRRTAGPPCPMLTGDGDCALARDASVVVVAVADQARRESLLEGHRTRHPGTPVVVVDRAPHTPLTGPALLAAVEEGLDSDA